MSRAAEVAGDEVRRLVERPAVQRAVGRAVDAARTTAGRLPGGHDEVQLSAADLRGVQPTGVLVDGAQARAARATARAVGLPRTLDGAASWVALGALAALLRVADDGRRRAVVIEAGAGSRSVFSRWATAAGFAPLHLDVTRPDVVGDRLDPGSVDLVALLHPRSTTPDDVDLELVRSSLAVRNGGLVVVSLQLGPVETGGFGVADVRALVARAGEQGLALVGELDIDDVARATRAQAQHRDRPIGLVLLTFRRR